MNLSPLKRYTELKSYTRLQPSPLNKVSKSKNSNRTRALDKKAAKFVKEIGVCEAEGLYIPCGGGLECAHIEGRDAKVLRFNPRNLICLCHEHHQGLFHKERALFEEFCENRDPGVFAWIHEVLNTERKTDFDKAEDRLKNP